MQTYIRRALLKALFPGLIFALSSGAFAQSNFLALTPATANGFPDAVSTSTSSSSASVLTAAAPASAFAMEAAQPNPAPIEPVAAIAKQPEQPHRFWDRENKLLLVAVGASATADFFTTRANLASGGRELNPVARVLAGSTPGLAANFGLETAGVIGASYLFHKMGRHRLERMTSFVDIGGSVAAVGYGLTHR